MGYDTKFQGGYIISPPLTLADQREYKRLFDGDQRDRPSGSEIMVAPFSYFCQWEVQMEGKVIVWDRCEKFYDYTEWLKYIIENFLKPRGYRLDGYTVYQGEGFGDAGVLRVDNNVIRKEVGIPNPLLTEPFDIPNMEDVKLLHEPKKMLGS